jgi:hypothetical protein
LRRDNGLVLFYRWEGQRREQAGLCVIERDFRVVHARDGGHQA